MLPCSSQIDVLLIIFLHVHCSCIVNRMDDVSFPLFHFAHTYNMLIEIQCIEVKANIQTCNWDHHSSCTTRWKLFKYGIRTYRTYKLCGAKVRTFSFLNLPRIQLPLGQTCRRSKEVWFDFDFKGTHTYTYTQIIRFYST